MTSFSTAAMQGYLSTSMSSMNQNKLNGLLAEVDFRNYLASLGFAERVSLGGWIARSEGANNFGHNTVVFFPEIIEPSKDYSSNRQPPNPDYGLHTICATFHQIGIQSYFCSPTIEESDNPNSIQWKAVQLGLPVQQGYRSFPENINGFQERTRRYNFLRYHLDVSSIPQISSLPEEFSKEHLRVTFQNRFMSEMSDVDGIFWGNQYTYPVEIKEKTVGRDNKVGDFFGLDVGPFVKLAFYAAKRGNLHSVFVVREIDNPTERNLLNWWIITFEQMAQFASWNPISGGTNMRGGGSTTIKIPKSEFSPMNLATLNSL